MYRSFSIGPYACTNTGFFRQDFAYSSLTQVRAQSSSCKQPCTHAASFVTHRSLPRVPLHGSLCTDSVAQVPVRIDKASFSHRSTHARPVAQVPLRGSPYAGPLTQFPLDNACYTTPLTQVRAIQVALHRSSYRGCCTQVRAPRSRTRIPKRFSYTDQPRTSHNGGSPVEKSQGFGTLRGR